MSFTPEPLMATPASDIAGHSAIDIETHKLWLVGTVVNRAAIDDVEFYRYCKLFAAAPDLLEACIQLRDLVMRLANERDTCLHDYPEAYIADAAIAKATTIAD